LKYHIFIDASCKVALQTHANLSALRDLYDSFLSRCGAEDCRLRLCRS
jgi:hypothetical protein